MRSTAMLSLGGCGRHTQLVSSAAAGRSRGCSSSSSNNNSSSISSSSGVVWESRRRSTHRAAASNDEGYELDVRNNTCSSKKMLPTPLLIASDKLLVVDLLCMFAAVCVATGPG